MERKGEREKGGGEEDEGVGGEEEVDGSHSHLF